MIYKLKVKDNTNFDCYTTKIVRADSEKRAREIANIVVANEKSIWEDKTKVSCKQVFDVGRAQVIHADFRTRNIILP